MNTGARFNQKQIDNSASLQEVSLFPWWR